ncbi:unnamed protein product [Symbiodinium natans]|uniref:WWE domain-containing protein n=1 Tax=Symbiodinium natans TaxID=878477 RepID=A0A812V6I2_9DINO|nr:unnamed protein product [Symbiodinium natans]
MSEYRRVALLVVLLVVVLSTPAVSIFGLPFLASFQAVAGIAIPMVCAAMSGGFLLCSLLRSKSEPDDHDFGTQNWDDETARRSPMRGPADEHVAPQTYGADEDPAPEETNSAANIGLSEKWQWSNGTGGRWMDFDADVALELSEAVGRGETLLKLSIRGRWYEINLQSMQQQSLATGRFRPIRKVAAVQSELM